MSPRLLTLGASVTAGISSKRIGYGGEICMEFLVRLAFSLEVHW